MFEVEDLSVRNLIHNVSFSVRAGEVFGIAGLVGSGRTETAKAIFGEPKKTSGRIRIEGQEVTIKSPYDAIKHGIGLLTENRKEEGLFLDKSVCWNVVSAALEKIKSNGILNFNKERSIVLDFVEALQIRLPPSKAKPATFREATSRKLSSLSG